MEQNPLQDNDDRHPVQNQSYISRYAYDLCLTELKLTVVTLMGRYGSISMIPEEDHHSVTK